MNEHTARVGGWDRWRRVAGWLAVVSVLGCSGLVIEDDGRGGERRPGERGRTGLVWGADGVPSVDGVRLGSRRAVRVGGPMPGDRALDLRPAQGDVKLGPSARGGGRVSLVVEVFEVRSGDASVAWALDERGRRGGLVVSSASGSPVVLGSVVGRVADGPVTVAVGGRSALTMQGFAHGDGLGVEAVDGDVALVDCTLGAAEVRVSGSGAARVEGCNAQQLRVVTRTGDVRVTGGLCNELTATTRSGGVYLRDVSAVGATVETTSGDGFVRDGSLGSLVFRSRSGDLTLNGARPVELVFESRTGTQRFVRPRGEGGAGPDDPRAAPTPPPPVRR